jgi:hypothetical protein
MTTSRKLMTASTCMVVLLLTTGCNPAYFGTILFLGFRDLIAYVGLALFFSVLTAAVNSGPWRKTFWLCFLISIFLTPLAGLIYFLIIVTRD